MAATNSAPACIRELFAGSAIQETLVLSEVQGRALQAEALASCHDHLLEIIAGLHEATLKAPRTPDWDEVRVDVSCLDAIADRMRQALTE